MPQDTWQPNPDVVRFFARKGREWWESEHAARMERERVFDEAVRREIDDTEPFDDPPPTPRQAAVA
jgi:hypothetical protein